MLATHNGRLYRFATYNGAKLNHITLEEKVLAARISRQQFRLQFKATVGSGGLLNAPQNGAMNRIIEETITARVEVNLYRGQELVFAGQSSHSSMEISEGAERLLSPYN